MLRFRHIHQTAGRGGFTLLELLVVLVIIAIAFWAVRPNLLHSLQADREHAALRRVLALLSSARTEAVARGRLVRIVMSPHQAELWAELQAEPDFSQPVIRKVGATEPRDYRSQFDVIPLLGRARLKMPEYLDITQLAIGGSDEMLDGEQIIYFFPDGRTSGAVLTLTGATGQEYEVDLSPATGEVRLRA